MCIYVLCTRVYVCTLYKYVPMNICMYVCGCMHYVSIYVCMYMYALCTCMYVCIYSVLP